MEVIQVSAQEYGKVFSNPSHVFNSAEFSELNISKCEEVFYLLFKDTKVRLGIVFGLRDKILSSPFSAPFGGFESAAGEVRLQQIDAALEALHLWASNKKMEGIRIVFPPFFYESNLLNKICNCLSRSGYVRTNVDLNYQFQTSKLNNQYEKTIWYNAQKNLKRSLSAGLTFEKIATSDAEKAYAIVSLNRRSRGYPLRMSLEQVLETGKVVDIDYFLVKKEHIAVAAAIAFHVAKDIVQVVYWGDVPQYVEYKTMNFLSYHVFKHYAEQGVKIIDIGPSTENSVPNYGLCEFKESIGCDILIKTEFFKKLTPAVLSATLDESDAHKPLRNIDAKEYNYFFPHDPNPFVSEKFISLNSYKVDHIVRLVPDVDKVQIGLVAGVKNKVLYSPFSAPFGGFHCKGESIYTSVIDAFIRDLLRYVKEEDIREIHITLAPDIYCERTNAKVANALTRNGFSAHLPEITNYVDLRQFNNVYTHNASRTYYNQAVNKGLVFAETSALPDKEKIYQLIVDNRARMGRPIYMSFEDIQHTGSIFTTDYFKVMNSSGEIVAGAIMYRAHEKIAYALFWGDALEGRCDRAMDFLILNLWGHYKAAGFTYIDLGISTEAGVPNEGLLRFKETHESLSSQRYTFTWKAEN